MNHTQNRRCGASLLAIISAYGSHLTITFPNLAIEDKIILLDILPYLIHQIQSLDVGIFQPFKHYHTDIIDKNVWLVDAKFDKLEFSESF